ncbi:MAG: ASCH domain-containing protein [Defluviitaleaceae bacterium]|nr:ASCH domain-containing protein [Defluviitaleaceae bacterium]
MNQQAQKYWNEFWEGKAAPTNVMAEQFGMEGTPMADELAHLIAIGRKTATCGAHALYKPEEIPTAGLYTVVLDAKDQPICIIRTTSVEVIPMNEVTEEFAAAEGEGDLSYRYWYDCHKEFFKIELAEVGQEFAEDMLLVCERFELVDVKKT